MTIHYKMLSRFFSRTIGIYYVILTMFLLLFIVYEMKQLYNKFQKGKRFAFYNVYVNEINEFADQLESSQIKSLEQVRKISKFLKTSLKKNSTEDVR